MTTRVRSAVGAARLRWAAFSVVPLFVALTLSGCGKTGASAPAAPVRAEAGSEPLVDAAGFAPTAPAERKGLWSGGLPPENKRQSGISTYYQVRAGDAPNRVIVRLRFEGAVAGDAVAKITGIDGALIVPAMHRTEWRLKPNAASELTLTLATPAGAMSYLNVYTLQNSKGTSRAVPLQLPAERPAPQRT